MATGYAGTFRALVVDNADPAGERRLLVSVPEVLGDAPVWAAAGSSSSAPSVGELVWVSFEYGDSDYPVWHVEDGGAAPTSGYTGWFRAMVVDDHDPEMRNRLRVSVPAVDANPVWANPLPDAASVEPPPVGAEVWVEYENGDPQYPRWVGVS